jgi:hypothetical protein
MIHILNGYPRETGHHHDTVMEARMCQGQADYDEAEAKSEIAAENAWLVAAETNEVQRMETDLDAQMEWWMQPATA